MTEILREAVLLVEDSRSLNYYLTMQIQQVVDVTVEKAMSLHETLRLIAAYPQRFFIAILDLNLPDAPNGEVVDIIEKLSIPMIILTGYLDESLRERILSKPNIIDYVVKRNASEINYVANLVKRVYRNRHIKILLVDDSTSFRIYLRELLHTHCYRTLEAANGILALNLLRDNPDVSLIITDFCMPAMNGQEFIVEVRRQFNRDQLIIVGIADQAQPATSATLLKAGANDFIAKPFLVEEFYCRITQSIENLELIRFFRDSAIRDFLTKLYNRRYLFDIGNKLFEKALTQSQFFAVIMIDVDYFKRINDTYGHLVGDVVLQQIANILQQYTNSNSLLARYGGEEFCLLLTAIDAVPANQQITSTHLFKYLEQICMMVAKTPILYQDQQLQVTISIGATMLLKTSLTATIDLADAALYQAKETGRNRVCIL